MIQEISEHTKVMTNSKEQILVRENGGWTNLSIN